jgi:cell wall-associated NlpC family hydrolase
VGDRVNTQRRPVALLVATLSTLLATLHASATPAPTSTRTSTATAHAPRPFDPAALRDGDVVFHTSRSWQSQAIALATDSPWTHVGLVLFDGGRPYVYEAIQPVSRTPLTAWVARGVGAHVRVKRLVDADRVLTPRVLAAMRARLRGWLGRSYDAWFQWDDARVYCSELVYKLYARDAGVELGPLVPMRSLRLGEPAVQALIAKRLGQRPPPGVLDAPISTPAAVEAAPELFTVMEGALAPTEAAPTSRGAGRRSRR